MKRIISTLYRQHSYLLKSDKLDDEAIVSEIDESITYAELTGEPAAIWSRLLTMGYLKIVAEQFYHGFTPGLIADLSNTHTVSSNRESGYGRYDVCIEPHDVSKDGIIIEFKVFDPKKGKTIEETARRAVQQIEDRKYETALKAKGIKNIRKYGFAFKGREVLIEARG